MRQMQIDSQSSRFYNIWNEYNLSQVQRDNISHLFFFSKKENPWKFTLYHFIETEHVLFSHLCCWVKIFDIIHATNVLDEFDIGSLGLSRFR